MAALEDPGDRFKSLKAAAKDFAKQYNGMSITYGMEVGTAFYSFTDENGETAYSYTVPVVGSGGMVGDNDLSDMPDNAEIIGDGHTHGGDEDVIKIDGEDYSDANKFSDQDIDVYENVDNDGDGKGNQYDKKVKGYVATPNGSLFEYDPDKNYTSKGTDKYGSKKYDYNKPVATDIPSDPASKSLRKNEIAPNKMPNVLPKGFDPNDHQKRKGYE